MSTFTKCDASVGRIVASLIEENHPDAHTAEVTVECLFAYAATDDHGDPKGPALKHHGYPALAVIRALPLKDRVAGRADCECVIDGLAWEEMTPERKAALLDHELTHIEVQRDKDGNIKSDDVGRPKVRMRPHDFHFGGFSSVAKRHGENSVEVTQCRLIADEYGQLLFGFAEAGI